KQFAKFTVNVLWPLHKDDMLFQSGRPTGLNIYFFPLSTVEEDLPFGRCYVFSFVYFFIIHERYFRANLAGCSYMDDASMMSHLTFDLRVRVWCNDINNDDNTTV
ncbi:hypothetical protein F5888DRAFT_1603500, partial [Russula emetica]